ncbi:hypothetical protein HDE_00464 [Halotydeus destructor]|nr:hypothetical protein HDE_00464 [Halotydeus destructor]
MKGTKNYIDHLNDVVKAYNSTKHTVTGVAPDDVNFSNAQAIFKNVYGAECPLQIRNKSKKVLSEGDSVRTKLDHKTFARGFTSNWSRETFPVSRINKTDRPQYRLKRDGKITNERFYPEEVQRVTEKYKQIEKVIKRDKDKVLVKWKYTPSSQNSWIETNKLPQIWKED